METTPRQEAVNAPLVGEAASRMAQMQDEIDRVAQGLPPEMAELLRRQAGELRTVMEGVQSNVQAATQTYLAKSHSQHGGWRESALTRLTGGFFRSGERLDGKGSNNSLPDAWTFWDSVKTFVGQNVPSSVTELVVTEVEKKFTEQVRMELQFFLKGLLDNIGNPATHRKVEEGAMGRIMGPVNEQVNQEVAKIHQDLASGNVQAAQDRLLRLRQDVQGMAEDQAVVDQAVQGAATEAQVDYDETRINEQAQTILDKVREGARIAYDDSKILIKQTVEQVGATPERLRNAVSKFLLNLSSSMPRYTERTRSRVRSETPGHSDPQDGHSDSEGQRERPVYRADDRSGGQPRTNSGPQDGQPRKPPVIPPEVLEVDRQKFDANVIVLVWSALNRIQSRNENLQGLPLRAAALNIFNPESPQIPPERRDQVVKAREYLMHIIDKNPALFGFTNK